MKILIDNSILYVGGGIQVATSFLYDLLYLNVDHEYTVIQSPNFALQINQKDFKSNFVFYDMPAEVFENIRKRSSYVKRIEEIILPDVIFTVFGPSYHKSNFSKVVGFAIPHLIYQDSPFFKTLSIVEKMKNLALNLIKRVAFTRNSDALIFESEEARKRFSKYFNGESYVVSNTLNEIFLRTENWQEFKHSEIKLDNFNILCLTANYPHKNLKIIPNIIRELVRKGMKDFKIMISIDEGDLLIEDDLRSHILFLGRVNINQLPSLYKCADALLMPSLLEVFSTTYLEAMFMRVPIVASDMPFARDICALGALYSAPLEAVEYAENLLLLHSNSDLKNSLVSQATSNLSRFGSSTDRTLRYLEIIEKHGNKK